GESRPVTLGTTIDFAFQGTAGQVALPRTVVAAEQVLSLESGSQTVRPGGEADYTVTFTNSSPLPVIYALSIGGVPSQWVGIDSTVTVPAGGTATKVLRLITGAFDVVGDYGFVINAVVDNVTTSVSGTLVLAGAAILPDAKPDSQGVVVNLTPTSATAGQGTAATYVARIYNVGSQPDEFVLSAAGLPSGFQTTFALNSINVPPGASNFRDVLLTVIPPQGTAADDYAFTVTATSSSDASISGVAASTLSVLAIGVAVDVTPESGSPESTYQISVTNIGQVRETFDLSLDAPAALMATLSEMSVTLDPGQSISIPIDVGAIDFAIPGSLSLVGIATSRSNPLVRAADGVGVDIAGLIAMTATFDNATHILPLPGTSSFLLLVDNIGNLEDQYSATITSTGGPLVANLVGLRGESTQSVPLFILPGLSRGAILLNAELRSAGTGTITVMVRSLTNQSVSTEITAQLQAGEQADQNADLSLVVTVDNASAKVGQNVTFQIALNNAGPDGATSVTVQDQLPAGLQYVNSTTSTGSYNATTGLWNVGSLARGTTTTLTIVAKLLTDQSVSNVAQVATSDQLDPDSTPGNNVVSEDDQFSASVGTCLTGGPLVAGMNRLVFSCVTPGGFAAFVVGSQPGSHVYSQWGTTVDIADPGVPAIGVGNINGVAVVLVNLTEAQLTHPLYVQAFEMLPAHKISNLIVAQHAPEKTGTPLVVNSIGLGTSPDTLPALKAGTPALKAAALARWQAAGASALLLEHLAAIDILFSDLPNDQLAATHGNFIVLDSNAAGHGWFVDTTPDSDVEFTLDASGTLLANTDATRDHIDALTVVLHEMGHVLGEPDEPTGSVNRLMSESLSPGMRRLPAAVNTPSMGALDVNRDGYVSPMDVLLIINELNLSKGSYARTTVAGNVLDVTGDGLLSPIDALQVINYLNRMSFLKHSSDGGEGERSALEHDNDRRTYIAIENPLVDDTLLDALAADAVNAWLKAKRNGRSDPANLSGVLAFTKKTAASLLPGVAGALP
ncbi:MAG: dockerin type I domain-containing protein, partial [Aureliella sp.]